MVIYEWNRNSEMIGNAFFPLADGRSDVEPGALRGEAAGRRKASG
jgi:hypothetical protein